ncbi:helix-turn-helix domain-containing protein [Nonomuraea typhae]|uniref:Helix-turn-helix domain-containing protein n=1 Tax=Nonomuraea typhae TaxID=2603600 RepID=A0ABW7Z2J0_9ACTN
MALDVESRPSGSPYIERVWRSRSTDVDQMLSIAAATWDLVFWEHRGRVSAAIQGPEPWARPAPVPEEAAFFGITFSPGTSMPHVPFTGLVAGAAEIPGVTRRSFWLKGSTWCVPDYGNAEEFAGRLVREGILERDPVVARVLRGESTQLSARTVQRRFLRATGLTRDAIRQIDRARHAAILLQEGMAVPDVVHRLGFFDQPHLARALSRYIGRTATQLRDPDPPEPLSLLYKT